MLRLTHAVADDFSASELHLLAIDSEVLFHFDDEICIRKSHLVADRWAKHLRIGGTLHCVGHVRLPRWGLRQCSHDRLVEAINQACAPVGDKPNFTGLARLEAHSRSRRNVQAIPKSSLSIECKSCVGLGEVIMTADLDRSVACVRDSKRDGRSILVKDNLARCWKGLARYHVSPP